jgi:hypothetical protein
LSDQLCHLCGAESVPATFACYTDTDGDSYTHIHAHCYLDADCYGYTDGYLDAQPNGYAHNNEHANCNRDLDHSSTDGYRYPIALGYAHHPHAHVDTSAPHGNALGYHHALAALRGFR